MSLLLNEKKKLYKIRPPANSGANPGRWHKKKKRRATYTIYIHIYHKTKVQKIYQST